MESIMLSLNRPVVVFIGLVLSLGCSAALAEVVVVVSARSEAPLFTKNQIADIFLGRPVQLPNGERAIALDQAEGVPTRAEFYAKFTGKSPAQVKAHWMQIVFAGRGSPPAAVSNSAEVKLRLIENPNAIGYIEKNMVDGSVRVLD
jgi:ABC-type phosphate transport system substrate-binding protein